MSVWVSAQAKTGTPSPVPFRTDNRATRPALRSPGGVGEADWRCGPGHRRGCRGADRVAVRAVVAERRAPPVQVLVGETTSLGLPCDQRQRRPQRRVRIRSCGRPRIRRNSARVSSETIALPRTGTVADRHCRIYPTDRVASSTLRLIRPRPTCSCHWFHLLVRRGADPIPGTRTTSRVLRNRPALIRELYMAGAAATGVAGTADGSPSEGAGAAVSDPGAVISMPRGCQKPVKLPKSP